MQYDKYKHYFLKIVFALLSCADMRVNSLCVKQKRSHRPLTFPKQIAIFVTPAQNSRIDLMDQYFRHFRNGKLYKLVCYATIEATGEEAVVYQAMYGERRFWIRPKTNFFEQVEHEGRLVPRFREVV